MITYMTHDSVCILTNINCMNTSTQIVIMMRTRLDVIMKLIYILRTAWSSAQLITCIFSAFCIYLQHFSLTGSKGNTNTVILALQCRHRLKPWASNLDPNQYWEKTNQINCVHLLEARIKKEIQLKMNTGFWTKKTPISKCTNSIWQLQSGNSSGNGNIRLRQNLSNIAKKGRNP